MAVTLSITNAEDATGTATIAGGNASDTNNLYQSAFTGTAGTLTMALEGTRTGNGTISLTGSGLWVWLLENITTGGTKTNVVVYAPITGGETTSVLYRILVQIQTQIRALSLTGIASANIVIKWRPRQFDTTTDPVPSIIISPAPIPESQPNYLTATDKIGYPIMITMIDRINEDYTANIARNTLWRQKISREFRYQPMDVTEVEHCIPEPKAIIDSGSWDKNLYVSNFVLRFLARETRGN